MPRIEFQLEFITGNLVSAGLQRHRVGFSWTSMPLWRRSSCKPGCGVSVPRPRTLCGREYVLQNKTDGNRHRYPRTGTSLPRAYACTPFIRREAKATSRFHLANGAASSALPLVPARAGNFFEWGWHGSHRAHTSWAADVGGRCFRRPGLSKRQRCGTASPASTRARRFKDAG